MITMRKTLLLALLLSCLTSTFSFNILESGTNNDSLLTIEGKFSLLAGLVFERLSLAKDVAGWKFINKAPIEDKEREDKLIASMVQSAIQFRIDTIFVKNFFQNQIQASKILQDYYINSLFIDSAVTESKDLEYIIRPSINQINNRMIIILKDTGEYLSQEDWKIFFKNEIKQQMDAFYLRNEKIKNSLLPVLIKLN